MANLMTQFPIATRVEARPSQHIEDALHTFFKQLSAGSPYAALLGGSLAISELNQTIFIGINPIQSIQVQNKQLIHTFFGDHDKTTALTLNDSNELFSYLRKQRWTRQAFLFAGYEFHQYCDPALFENKHLQSSNDDDLLLIDFQNIGRFDLASHTWTWHSSSTEKIRHYETLWQSLLNTEQSPKPGIETKYTIDDVEQYVDEFVTSLSKPAFENAVSTILGHIQSGDIYQANLSLSLKKAVTIDCPYRLYQSLCQQNPSPFSAFLKTPDSYIISNSPERLLAGHFQDYANLLETRPIAGTRGRGDNHLHDQEIADKLLHNEKEQAEHLMLVDLLRNDLGRVCKTGSVQVSELLGIERYSHVMHLVSNVVGELSPDYDHWDALKALFPGGTITGCPKIRCIQVLQALEPEARGFYTGGLGYLNFSREQPWGERSLDWNILIRTLKLSKANLTDIAQDKTPNATLPYNADSHGTSGKNHYLAHLQVGAGIVADSVAPQEYRECYRKAQAILGALYVAEQLASSPE